MQLHFLHQMMLNLLKQTTLILNSPGVMFHHIVQQFNTTLRRPTVGSVLPLLEVTWSRVVEVTHS